MEPFSISLWDKDDSLYSSLFMDQIEALNIFKSIDQVKDEKQANEFIQKGHAALIVIPENFIHLSAIGRTPPILVMGNSSQPFRGNLVKNLVHTATLYIGTGQSHLNSLYYFKAKFGFTQEELDWDFRDSVYQSFLQTLGRKEVFENLEDEIPYPASVPVSILASCLVLFMGFSGLPVVKILLEEKRSKVALRLKGAQVNPLLSYASKIFLTVLISMIQVLLLYVFTLLFFEISLDINYLQFMLSLSLCVFAFSGFHTLIVTLSTTAFMADIIGNLSLFLMALISGCFYPTYTLPQVAQTLGKYTIHRQAIEGFLRSVRPSKESAAACYLSLFILGAVFYLLSLYFVKYKELN